MYYVVENNIVFFLGTLAQSTLSTNLVIFKKLIINYMRQKCFTEPNFTSNAQTLTFESQICINTLERNETYDLSKANFILVRTVSF